MTILGFYDSGYENITLADIHLKLILFYHSNFIYLMQLNFVRKLFDDWYLYYQFGKTWEKLQMAARVIVIARYTGVNAIAGLHTPDTFTNQLQTSFSEPRLLILTDPRIDHHTLVSANNKGKQNIDCLFWILAIMVLQIKLEEANEEEEEATLADYAEYSITALFKCEASLGDSDQLKGETPSAQCP
ncbi:hypothetical protein DCAR_0934787 [Daucus carota subsp. sativus]|uniref:Uncharacterized protein n=1 Tax=Daucus carota subsp. sativus TaxID=79200 RepID=A0AAF0XWF3_DAUCS|nr:hypothetical protein DCAR_0934787 [Daucus carota subsp. sativus]